MAQIPLQSRNKRPQFFDNQGIDPLITMTMELMTELWVVKERMYAMEDVLSESGIDIQNKLEMYKPSKESVTHLESTRRQYVETVMRAFSSDFVPTEVIQDRIDGMTASMTEADEDTAPHQRAGE